MISGLLEDVRYCAVEYLEKGLIEDDSSRSSGLTATRMTQQPYEQTIVRRRCSGTGGF